MLACLAGRRAGGKPARSLQQKWRPGCPTASFAAGLFANMIGVVSGLVFGIPHLIQTLRAPDLALDGLRAALAASRWHPALHSEGVHAVAATEIKE